MQHALDTIRLRQCCSSTETRTRLKVTGIIVVTIVCFYTLVIYCRCLTAYASVSLSTRSFCDRSRSCTCYLYMRLCKLQQTSRRQGRLCACGPSSTSRCGSVHLCCHVACAALALPCRSCNQLEVVSTKACSSASILLRLSRVLWWMFIAQCFVFVFCYYRLACQLLNLLTTAAPAATSTSSFVGPKSSRDAASVGLQRTPLMTDSLAIPASSSRSEIWQHPSALCQGSSVSILVSMLH